MARPERASTRSGRGSGAGRELAGAGSGAGLQARLRARGSAPDVPGRLRVAARGGAGAGAGADARRGAERRGGAAAWRCGTASRRGAGAGAGRRARAWGSLPIQGSACASPMVSHGFATSGPALSMSDWSSRSLGAVGWPFLLSGPKSAPWIWQRETILARSSVAPTSRRPLP